MFIELVMLGQNLLMIFVKKNCLLMIFVKHLSRNDKIK